MAWQDWQYIRLKPTSRGDAIAGYKPDVADNTLRLFVNDDTEMHSQAAAEKYCKDYLSISGYTDNCPTEQPVIVYFSDSFELARGLFKLEVSCHYQFDGILQDLIDDESRAYTGMGNLALIKQGVLSPHPVIMVVTNDGQAAAKLRQNQLAGYTLAIAKDPDVSHRKKPEAEEIRRFFKLAQENRVISTDPLIQEYRAIIGHGILRQIRQFIGYLDNGSQEQAGDHSAERMPVVILGESGTGKEAVARLIHAFDRGATDRQFQRFQPVLIAGIPEGVLEGELFGVENLGQGKLSEQNQAIKGYLRMAEHGTYFQDEVGDLPISIQGKLLRFLQQKQIRPVGADKWITVEDVRCVFATNKNLIHSAQTAKNFRQDFLHRIDGLTLELPSLKEREEDHETLVNFFLGQFRAAEKCNNSQPLSDDVMQTLMDKCKAGALAGNIRELKNQIRRLLQMTPQGQQVDMEVFKKAQQHSLFPLKDDS